MDTTRITVVLDEAERKALVKMARDSLREPRDQARLLIRLALESRGYLQRFPLPNPNMAPELVPAGQEA